MEANERKNVAVIGTGMAGLVVAYMLRNDPRGRFDVEVLEKVKKKKNSSRDTAYANQS